MRIRGRTTRRQWVAIVVIAALLAAAGCTSEDPADLPSGAKTSPRTTPVSAFPPLADRTATGARVSLEDVAAEGQRVVTVGQYADGIGTATFGYSTDGGQTWQAGTAPAPEQAVSEFASDVAVRSTAQGLAWVATGTSGTHLASWTSSDGISWQRHLIEPAVADLRTDDLTDLVASPAGFFAVGRSVDAAGDDHPRVWRSPDGVAWTAQHLSGLGTVNGLAARGKTLVALGSTDDDVRVWRSLDTGGTWARVSKIPRVSVDEGFNRSFSDITVDQGQFLAIGSFFGMDRYQPMIFRSRDGLRWSFDQAGMALGAGGGSFGEQLVSRGGDVAAVVQTNETLDHDMVFRRLGGAWLPTTDPRGGDEKAVWDIGGLARSSRGWVAAAGRQLDNSAESQLWLSRRTLELGRVDPPPPPRATPVLVPAEVASWGGSQRVIGEAQDRRALWSQAADGTFGPPQELNLGASAAIEGLEADSRGLLAYGSTTGGNSNHATLWWSGDGKKFAATGRHTFEKETRYSSSSIAAVHKFGSRWFAVGDRTANADLNDSALIYTSTDGRHWTAGKPARLLTKAKGDVWSDVTDLSGDHDRRRSMSDVTQTSRDFLAVGTSEENGPLQATVWHASDGRTWRSEVIRAHGFDRSGITSAASVGQHTVLFGWAGRGTETDTTPYVWRSGDGGRSWQGQAIRNPGDDPGALVVVGSTFVLTGSTAQEVDHPWLLRSSDGASWQPLELAGYAAAPDDDVWLSDVTADGGDLMALVRIASRTGAATVLVRQPVA